MYYGQYEVSKIEPVEDKEGMILISFKDETIKDKETGKETKKKVPSEITSKDRSEEHTSELQSH